MEIKNLFADTIFYEPIEFDFSDGFGEKWDIALDLTEEERDNEEFSPAMNYIYPLPIHFKRDMINKFGENWRKKIKNLLVDTTVVEIEGNYYLALTGGGMNFSWEIAESYINLGYLPPLAFCNLPEFAGKEIKGKNKLIIQACLRSIEIANNHLEYLRNKLEAMLKKDRL